MSIILTPKNSMEYFILYIYIVLGQSIIHFQGLLVINFQKINFSGKYVFAYGRFKTNHESNFLQICRLQLRQTL